MATEAGRDARTCGDVATKTTPFFMAASEILSILIFLCGSLVLLGWALDIPALKSVFPNFVAMKANTAFAFVLSGASLWLLQIKWQASPIFRRLALICSLLVLGIGLLTLSEYLFHWDLGIDQLLFKEPPDALLTSSPGRMAFNSANNFSIIGLALSLLAFQKKHLCFFAQILMISEGIISALALVGYLYHADPLLIGPHSSTAMALHTTVLFLAVFLAALFCRPGCGFMASMSSDAVGGKMLRRLLPVAILLPLILGWLALHTERAWRMSDAFGDVIVATANLAFMILYVSILSSWLNKSDAERTQAEETFRRKEEQHRTLLQTIPDIVYEVDTEGKFVFVNEAVRQLGFEPEELLEKHFSAIVHPEDVAAVTRLHVLRVYEGKTTGERNAPKLFDERRTGDRQTRGLEVRLLAKGEKTPDGQVPVFRYGEVHSSGKWNRAVTEEDKVYLGSIGIIRDITGRKQAEQEKAVKIDATEKLNQLMIGREKRIVEMKREVNAMLKELGREKKYGV